MSFNVRYANPGDGVNQWGGRKQLVVDTIKQFNPDVLGLQEPLPAQMTDLQNALPDYTLVGCGRDDGQKAGEFTAMLVRSNRFDIVEQGKFWFSDTPDEAGSIGWGATLPRLCVWARLADRQSENRSFVAYNTHFDHRSRESRSKAAAAIASHLATHHQQLPCVVMGDFNTSLANGALQKLVDGQVKLAETFKAEPGQPVGTFNGFRGEATGEKIDYVLATSHWSVVESAIDRTSREGRYPSDHFPVTAVLQLEVDR
jgi:endonuclease/exonuclease/phosphatase family metal-dependent hydrolase